MSRTSRRFHLLPAILAVWCLGCDAFESIAESLAESAADASSVVADVSTSRDESSATPTSTVGPGAEAAADACHCVLGHAAVISAALPVDRPVPTPAAFVDRPPAVVLPAPEPLLRPPVT